MRQFAPLQKLRVIWQQRERAHIDGTLLLCIRFHLYFFPVFYSEKLAGLVLFCFKISEDMKTTRTVHEYSTFILFPKFQFQISYKINKNILFFHLTYRDVEISLNLGAVQIHKERV